MRNSNIPEEELAQRRMIGEKYKASQELIAIQSKIRSIEYTLHVLNEKMDALVKRSKELRDNEA